MTVAEAIREGAARLTQIADNPRLEARLLLGHALGVAQTDLVRDLHRPVETERFHQLLRRREAHEPVALILGHREFWSMDFEVSAATLIPRADSETLIEAALDAFSQRPPPRRILDLGTGTGCLLLALLRAFPDAFGVGIDLAPAAAALARRNSVRLGLGDRTAIVCGDWTDGIAGTFDLVVSNPPYIASDAVAGLMPDVADYEPRLALDGGADGYAAYRTILSRLGGVMVRDGVAVLELGVGQADRVGDMALASGLRMSLRADLACIARAAILTHGRL
jgi:release factor glutamine methyltransferase